MTSADKPTIHDPNQRDFFAPKPGRSFVGEFKGDRSVHVTLKVNTPEADYWAAIGAPVSASRVAAAARIESAMLKNLRSFIEQMREKHEADLHANPPIIVEMTPPATSGSVAGPDECLSCQ